MNRQVEVAQVARWGGEVRRGRCKFLCPVCGSRVYLPLHRPQPPPVDVPASGVACLSEAAPLPGRESKAAGVRQED